MEIKSPQVGTLFIDFAGVIEEHKIKEAFRVIIANVSTAELSDLDIAEIFDDALHDTKNGKLNINVKGE